MNIKQVHLHKHFQKICSLLANFSLFLHIFLPYLAAIPAYAEDPTPTPVPTEIIENTPTGVDEVNTPEPTAEASPEVTPEITPEVTPEPTAVPTGVDEVNTPEPTVEPTAIPTLEPTAVPTGVDEVNTPEPTPTETVNIDIGTQAPVVETEVTPTAIPVVEKICLTGGEIIEDTTSEDWIINDTTGISETKENVKLGLRYVYPQDTKVTIIFKCLPADESLRTPLKIQKIKSSELKLPDELGDIGEYAYDITTGMSDGTFEYDVTLPKPDDSTAEVSYIEKSIDDAKNNEVKVDEIKPVEESKVEQQSDVVKAIAIDHFTIFIITSPTGPTVTSAIINGGKSVTVIPGATILVTLTVGTSGNEPDDWRTTGYKIGTGSWQCSNTPNHDGDGTYTEVFPIIAPSSIGTYDLTLRAYDGDSCGGSYSDDYSMNNAITVITTSSTANPTLDQACGLDIA